jgi:hypothetical protein
MQVRFEDRDVLPAGDDDAGGFVPALSLEVLFEALAQHAGIGADDVVFAGMEGRWAAERPSSYFGFVDLVLAPVQLSVADVEQEAGEQGRTHEARAGHDALGQLPLLSGRGLDGFARNGSGYVHLGSHDRPPPSPGLKEPGIH